MKVLEPQLKSVKSVAHPAGLFRECELYFKKFIEKVLYLIGFVLKALINSDSDSVSRIQKINKTLYYKLDSCIVWTVPN